MNVGSETVFIIYGPGTPSLRSRHCSKYIPYSRLVNLVQTNVELQQQSVLRRRLLKPFLSTVFQTQLPRHWREVFHLYTFSMPFSCY